MSMPETDFASSSSSWTDERIALLTKLWAEGQSARQIAAVLGGVTRNAVIGKVSRLNLPKRLDHVLDGRQGGRKQNTLRKRKIVDWTSHKRTGSQPPRFMHLHKPVGSDLDIPVE